MNAKTKQSVSPNKTTAAQFLKHVVIALVLVSLAAGLRVWPLQALDSRLPWLTFYPAVIAVALYAGFYAGLFATLLACTVVAFLWPIFAPQPFITDGFDLLGMSVFAAVSVLIAYLFEAVHRTRKALARVEAALNTATEREQFFKSVSDDIPNMIGYWDRDLRCRYANNAYDQWFGKSPDEVIGMTFRELAGEKLFAMNEPHIRRVLAGEPQRFERTLVKPNGEIGHIIGHYIPDFDTDGSVKGFAIQSSDVTALKESEAKLELAACVFENTLDGVLITDADGIILSVNPAFTEITGYKAEEAVGQTPRILKSNRHDRKFYTDMWQQLNTRGLWRNEIWNRRKDGDLYLERMTISMVRDADGRPVHYVAVFSDITALWRKDEHIKHLAFHDALTDLPNRTLLMDRINQKLVNADREPCNLALLFLDLDGFKPINDKFGHNVGDHLLKEVSKKLLARVRQSDTVARLGGDEFIILLNNPKGRDEIASVAEQIVSSINEPMEILGELLQIGISVGIAVFPADATNTVELIKNADTAMYTAKELGRNHISFYTPK